MDTYPRYLTDRQRTIHSIVNLVVLLAGISYIHLYNRTGFAFLVLGPGLLICFGHITLLLASSIGGYTISALTLLVTFAGFAAADPEHAYQTFALVFPSILLLHAARKGWYRKFSYCLAIALAITVWLGPVWYLILCSVSNGGFKEVSGPGLVALAIMSLPESLLNSVIVYALVHYLPERYQQYFEGLHYYTSAYANQHERRRVQEHRRSVLAYRIMFGLMSSLVALSIAVVVMNAIIFRTIIQNNAAHAVQERLEQAQTYDPDLESIGERFNEKHEIVPGDAISVGDSEFGFILKQIMMALALILPLGIYTYRLVNRHITYPIVNLSDYMQDFISELDGHQSLPEDFPHVETPSSHDEISDLYLAIDETVDVIRDYTERIRTENQLQADLNVARAANDAKSTFLSNVSHEIRTPINAVLGMDEMILRETKEDQIAQYATNIQDAGRTLLALINDILDFSKIEEGKMEIIPAEYELSSVVNDLVNMVSLKVHDKGLNFQIRMDENIPHLLYGDEFRIRQCILNILNNAVKYTQRGSIVLKLSYAKKNEHRIALTVEVADTGSGIRKEDMERLFAPFERIDEASNRTTEGSGLGISIVQNLLTLMGSKLEVASVYGRGSVFSFTVDQEVMDWSPVGEYEEKWEQARKARQQYQESFHAENARILVIDDTKMNLLVVEKLLQKTGVLIDTALSGREALELVKKWEYDVIFIDHRMPGMDGIETLHAMKTMDDNRSAEAPCIALTANAISGAREKYFAEGFSGYLSKPVSGSDLEQCLQQFLPAEKIHREAIQQSAQEEQPKAPEAEELKAEPEPETDPLTLVRGIDLETGMHNCGDDRDILISAMTEYLHTIDDKAERIEQDLEDGDIKDYTIQVHALKSSSRIIGAMELSEMAAFLEQCGDAGDIDVLRQKTPDLLTRYRSYKVGLSPLDPSAEKQDDRPLISLKRLQEALGTMREVVEAFDFDSADEIMKMLQEYRMPDDFQSSYKQLRTFLSNVDREQILKLLNEIKVEHG